MTKKFIENKCKKYFDNTQVRTGFLHALHKVVFTTHLCFTHDFCTLQSLVFRLLIFWRP